MENQVNRFPIGSVISGVVVTALVFVTMGVQAANPEASFGGQYRINAYSADNDDSSPDNQTAARVRIRQNIDLKFDEQFSTHVQFELGHTSGNSGTTGRGISSNPGTGEVRVRHAVMAYKTARGDTLLGGILPLSDKFGDTLFSSDWDYNPVAVAGLFAVGPGELRLAAGTINENTESNADDDITHYQIDYSAPIGNDVHVDLGASFIQVPDPTVALGMRSANHSNYAIGVQFPIGGLQANAFIAGSNTDKEIIGTTSDGSGIAGKVELTGGLGSGKFGVMVTYAEGAADGSGFLPVMSLIGHQGYWGYTGILTVQGPTDTGFDGDSVNISNNGYGLTTVQGKYSLKLTDRLDGYLAAGWFGSTEAPVGRDDSLGTDFIVMATYHLTDVLAIDFGAAAASLDDSVSGYGRGAAGSLAPSTDPGPYNQAAGASRDKTVLFSRIQAEF